MLSQGTPEAVARYRQARRTAASAVTEAKQRVWEEFGDVMEKDFRSAPKRFWKLQFDELRIASLLFADDVVLMAPSACDLQHSLDRFATKSEAAGMRISIEEIMVLSRKSMGLSAPSRK